MTKCNRLTPFTERETIQCQFYHQTIEICAGPKLSNAETANLTHFFSKYQKIVWLDVTSEISSSFLAIKTDAADSNIDLSLSTALGFAAL